MGKVRFSTVTKCALLIEAFILLISVAFGFYQFIFVLGLFVLANCAGVLWSYFVYRMSRDFEDEDWEI